MTMKKTSQTPRPLKLHEKMTMLNHLRQCVQENAIENLSGVVQTVETIVFTEAKEHRQCRIDEFCSFVPFPRVV